MYYFVYMNEILLTEIQRINEREDKRELTEQMNKIQVRIKEWSTYWSVKIFDTNTEYPRVRTESSQSHLNKIMKEEGLNQFRFNVIFQ
jgi:archaellum biogenesis ATPase FlaH